MKPLGPVHGNLHPCRGRSASGGFSLVELVIVVAIIGVFATLAVPRVTGMLARQKAMQTGRRIGADLQRVAAAARAASRPWSVKFTRTPPSYVVTGVDASSKAVTWTVALGDEPYGAVMKSVSLGPDATVVFSGHGLPDRSGKVVVQALGASCSITVDPSLRAPTVALE